MKNVLEGFIIALSMYSKIPTPYLKWKKESMKFAMCFLPVIGIICFVFLYIWYKVCIIFNISSILFASGAIVIPLIISGGIHLDGLLDTSDAIGSYAEKDKKLEILKDVHIGAFAVIAGNIYIIVLFGLWAEVYKYSNIITLALSAGIISRIIGGGVQLFFNCAKTSGLAYIFYNNSSKNIVRICYAFWTIIYFMILFYLFEYIVVLLFILLCLLILYFKRMIYKNFGGITGDLCGWILQMSEVIVLIIALIGGIVGA